MMMTTTTKTQKWLLSLLSALFMLVVFTACSSTEGNDSGETPERPQPETPIDNDDWQTVSASGGTVEKGDLSITFPSGTFTSDAKVAVTEVQKGTILGEDETSPFYQVIMPVQANRPFTISVKCDEQADDIYLITYIATPSMHLIGANMSFPVSYDATYSNGKYSATLPAFENENENGDLFFSVGLAHRARFSSGSNIGRTRYTDGEKEGEISWYFETDRKFENDYSQILPTTVEILNGYIHDALKQIDKLGFKIADTPNRRIPITVFKADNSNKDLFGEFKQHFWSNTKSWFAIKETMLTSLERVQSVDTKATIIHELLHYFQAEYDQRSPYSKYRDCNSDELLMYEAGGQWIEKFVNNGKLIARYDYLQKVKYFMKGLVFQMDNYNGFFNETDQDPHSGTARQAHGYAMGTLLYYLSDEVGDDKIVDLYKCWANDNSGWFGSSNLTTMQCLKKFAERNNSYIFMGGYESFISTLLNEEIVPNLTALKLESEEKTISAGNTTAEFIGKCNAYGVDAKNIILDLKKNDLESKKQIIITLETEDVNTYLYDKNNKVISNGAITAGSPLILSSATLEKYIVRGEIFSYFTLVNTANIKDTDSPKEYKLVVEIKDEGEETGGASVSPDQLTYKWEGESQDVIIKKGSYKYCGADVPEEFKKWISVVPYEDGKVSIAVQPNLTFESRDGKVNCWVSNKENPTDEEKKYIQPAVNITQGPVEGVDWNPKSLNFGAEGGSAKISFEFGGFKRFGAQVHEEGWNWCGVAAANGKLTITVQPNPSSESRECIVDAYVTNSQNPTEEDKVIMPITVFQEGNDGQTAANNLKELWGTWTFTYTQHDWNTVYSVTFGKDGSYYYECNDYKHPEESFTRTGTYKVLDFEAWNPTPEGVIGLADIEESFHNSLTGKDVVRQWTVRLYNNGQLGYENKLWKKAE